MLYHHRYIHLQLCINYLYFEYFLFFILNKPQDVKRFVRLLICYNIYRVNSLQRKVLHLAAVFACNFPNYLYGAAQQLLAQNDMDFAMLRPLILETAQKVQERFPGEVQTGPAVRNDENTMATHLQMLNNEPDLALLYRLLSQQIIKNNNPGHGDR